MFKLKFSNSKQRYKFYILLSHVVLHKYIYLIEISLIDMPLGLDKILYEKLEVQRILRAIPKLRNYDFSN